MSGYGQRWNNGILPLQKWQKVLFLWKYSLQELLGWEYQWPPRDNSWDKSRKDSLFGRSSVKFGFGWVLSSSAECLSPKEKSCLQENVHYKWMFQWHFHRDWEYVYVYVWMLNWLTPMILGQWASTAESGPKGGLSPGLSCVLGCLGRHLGHP